MRPCRTIARFAGRKFESLRTSPKREHLCARDMVSGGRGLHAPTKTTIRMLSKKFSSGSAFSTTGHLRMIKLGADSNRTRQQASH